jgi:hypothetical protein
MVFEGFIFLANIFSRLFGYFSSMAKFAMTSGIIRYFLFGLFYAFLLMLITFTGFFFYYMVTNIVKTYNMISILLNVLESGVNGGGVVSTMFFFMSISGITAGIQAFFPFVASALLFILIKALYRSTLFFYRQVKEVVDTMIATV